MRERSSEPTAARAYEQANADVETQENTEGCQALNDFSIKIALCAKFLACSYSLLVKP
jgi:hypothetical protein